MFEVFKVFYTTHYNLGAVSLLLFLLLIFLLTKKNVKVGLVVLALLLVFNVFIFKRTDGKSWTIYLDPEPSSDPYYQPQPRELTFSVKKNWTITDKDGKTYHWCWLDTYWDEFANTDLVAAIWGENSSKKMMKSSEGRINGETGE